MFGTRYLLTSSYICRMALTSSCRGLQYNPVFSIPFSSICGNHANIRYKFRKPGEKSNSVSDQSKNLQLKIEKDPHPVRSITDRHHSGRAANSILQFQNSESNMKQKKTSPLNAFDGEVKARISLLSGEGGLSRLNSKPEAQELAQLNSGPGTSERVVANPKTRKKVSKTSKAITQPMEASETDVQVNVDSMNGSKVLSSSGKKSVKSVTESVSKNGTDVSSVEALPNKKRQSGRKKSNLQLGSVNNQSSVIDGGNIKKTSQGKKAVVEKNAVFDAPASSETTASKAQSSKKKIENPVVKKNQKKEVPVRKISGQKNSVHEQLSSTATQLEDTPSIDYPLCERTQKSTSKDGTKHHKRNFVSFYPPTDKSVLVVESVTKAKTIQNYLGDMFEVLPSHGHVRDLAGRSGSVRPEDDFSMVWEVPSSAWTHIKSIKVALNGARNLILASDPDREGEAIAWHIAEMLQQQDALHSNLRVARVVFHEITESSIKRALQNPRDISMDLVNAYLARRSLDYLIGFSISPLLWRKLPGCQSAGRVQSAALALICDRETEIEDFKAREYWTIQAESRSGVLGNSSFSAQPTLVDSTKVDKFLVNSQMEAERIAEKIRSSSFEVVDVKRSQYSRSPPVPYITSTLQQDASNKLRFSASYTMKLAQKLYEGVKLSDKEATGLITYMRTDGLHVSAEAVQHIRSLVVERYGQDFVSKSTQKNYKKVKNAQEAHEAIRPTDILCLPSKLLGVLDEDSHKLYTLIWCQTMACQMEPTIFDRVQVDLKSMGGDTVLRSSSSKVALLGHKVVYKDSEAADIGHDEDEGKTRNEDFELLSVLKPGDLVQIANVETTQHFTEAPPRYSEGSLVKKLEELGIGRPSTYASILKVLQDRNYVTIKSRRMFPEFRGRMVSAFLCHYFSEVTDYSFTADMETELDNVSAGLTEWRGLLKDYWTRFSSYCDRVGNVTVHQVERMMEETFENILFSSLPDNNRTCPSCFAGRLIFKVSKHGAGYFIGCDQHPKCSYIARMIFSEEDDGLENEKPDECYKPKVLGFTPHSNEKILLKDGPYGFYIQLGEDRTGYRPKRASLSQFKDVESITLEDALELLKYPVTLGDHPKDNYPVVLRISKFGFAIRHRHNIVPVPKNVEPQTITMDMAIKYLSSKNVKYIGRPRGITKSKSQQALEDVF
ncbi:hypothetical protein AMTR_s00006p00253660 [Amborella trichopoda]|uniref:DNA topoisomerase n=2 Tax=Amborella trichopoda TaxID=13333 RepID=W1PCV0_AMBTC|nr:hypothetical protein AMTR_s00006p00253660 [Amborella trichopoda]